MPSVTTYNPELFSDLFPWTTTTTTSVFTCSPNNNLNSVVCPHFLSASPPSKKHEQRHAQEDVLPPTRAPTLSLS